MRKLLTVLFFALALPALADVKPGQGVGSGSCGYAVSAVNAGGVAPSCVAAPTVAPSPTAPPSPTAIASLPLSLANGGHGQDMTGKWGNATKALGAGNVSATSFLTVTTTTLTGQSIGVIYKIFGTDGTNNAIWGGFQDLQCEDKGGTNAAQILATGTANSNGQVSAGGSLAGAITFSTAVATDACSIRIAINYTAGTPTGSTIDFIWFSPASATVTYP